MTDIVVILHVQDATNHLATNATQTWVPTVAVAATGALLLPAPKVIAILPDTSTTIMGIKPCDGSAGWSWFVTTTEDGVIRDQRYVLVPDSLPDLYFNDLTQVRPEDLHNMNADQVYVGLTAPPALFRGWWLQSAPGNPALGIETGSGDLRSVL